MNRCYWRAAAAFLLCCLPTSAVATVHVVDAGGSGDFIAVQAAVDAAANRDTIWIRAGLYEENIVVVGDCLTFVGDGREASIVRAITGEPAIAIQDMAASPGYGRISDLCVEQPAAGAYCVNWGSDGAMVFERCDLVGVAGGGGPHGAVSVTDCCMTRLGVSACYPSDIVDSTIESARLSGTSDQYGVIPADFRISGSSLGDIELTTGARLSADLSLFGDLSAEQHCALDAEDCAFAALTMETPELRLEHCTVSGDVVVEANLYFWVTTYFGVDLMGCLVDGNVGISVYCEDDWRYVQCELRHNTITGDLTTSFSVYGIDTYIFPYQVRTNIVLGSASLYCESGWSWVYAADNDVLLGLTMVADAGTVERNLSADPLFCGASDFTLQECSPCAGAAEDGSNIGAFGVGCECYTAVEERSWGSIKALYR